MRMHADSAHAAELEEREHEIVVTGVEIEAELDDRTRLLQIRVRLLHRPYRRKLGELRDRLGFEVEDDAARNVVRDDWPTETAAISSKCRTIPRTGGL